MSYAKYLPLAAVLHDSMDYHKLYKMDRDVGIFYVSSFAYPLNYDNLTHEDSIIWTYKKYKRALNLAKKVLKQKKIDINLGMEIAVGINNNKKFNIIVKDYEKDVAYYITNEKFEICNIKDDFLNAKLYFNN